MDLTATLQQLGVSLTEYAGPDLAVRSPIDGAQLTSALYQLRNVALQSACSVRPYVPFRNPWHAW